MNHEPPAPPTPNQPPAPGDADEQPPPQDTNLAEHHEQQEQQEPQRPQIWVGSLSDYNNGVLHGSWLDADREPEEIQADIQTMLAASPWTARTGEPAEEWGIFDTDNFGPCRIDQHEDLDWISGVATGIAEHGPAFAAWADVVEEPGLLDNFDAAYLGHYDNLHAYVEQLINDLGYDELLDRAVPSSLRPYVKIDVAATARDLDGDLHVLAADGGGVWIFDAI